MPKQKKQKSGCKSIQTGGGANIGGSVFNTGDFIGRDQTNITTRTGEDLGNLFAKALEIIDSSDRTQKEKEEIEAAVKTTHDEVTKGEAADESIITKMLEVIVKRAPEIVDTILSGILNPSAGAAVAVQTLARHLLQPPQ